MSEAQPVTGAEAVKPKGRVVDPVVLRLDPGLLHAPLAAPWRRAGAMALDLMVVGLLSLLTGPVLGLFTGFTLASLGSPRVSDARIWRTFRWVLILLGAGVMILSILFLTGRPLVRTAAFNLGRVESGPSLEPVMVPPGASTTELRRAVTRLEQQVETLRAHNERLRESARGNSLLNAASDFSRSLGLTFGWAGVYFTLAVGWLRGRTPGKFLFRIRVVRLDGKDLTCMDSFVRNSGYAAGLATGLIGFLRVLWGPNPPVHQDKVAGTVVV